MRKLQRDKCKNPSDANEDDSSKQMANTELGTQKIDDLILGIHLSSGSGIGLSSQIWRKTFDLYGGERDIGHMQYPNCGQVSSGTLSSLSALVMGVSNIQTGMSGSSLVMGLESPNDYPFYLDKSREDHYVMEMPFRDPVETNFLDSLPHYMMRSSDPDLVISQENVDEIYRSKRSELKIEKIHPTIYSFTDAQILKTRVSERELDRMVEYSLEDAQEAGVSGGLGIEVNERDLLYPRYRRENYVEAISLNQNSISGTGLKGQEVDMGGEKIVRWVDAPVRQQIKYPGLHQPDSGFDLGSGSLKNHHVPELTSGACAVLIGSDRFLSENSEFEPLCEIVASKFESISVSNVESQIFTSISKFLKSQKIDLNGVDHFELHENSAFLLANLKKMMGGGMNRVNRLGGSLAVGNPLGATGARLVLNASNILKGKKGETALVVVASEIGDLGMVLLKSIR